MKRMYLFCDQGMSTSLLASIMQDCANEHLLPIEILAFPHKKISGIIEERHPDVILLGPQVKYLLEETKRKFKDYEIPILLIDQEDYGMMNGEKVLKKALLALQKKKQSKGENEK